MSRVYWSSKERTEELHGSERAWLDLVCTRIGSAPLVDDLCDLREGVVAKVMGMLPPGDYLQPLYRAALDRGSDYTSASETFYQRYREHISSGTFMNNFVLGPDKVAVSFTNIYLNTAIALGSDPVKLAARIHGSCELFGYVEGPDRSWVADVIDDGIALRIYRTAHPQSGVEGTQGWEKVQELLRERDDGPVVMSYSVTDSFPSMRIADWQPAYEGALGIFSPEDWEAIDPEERDEYAADFLWAELPFSEQWDLSIAGLRKNRWWARIGPDTIEHLYTPELTSYDLIAPDSEDRVAAALAAREAYNA